MNTARLAIMAEVARMGPCDELPEKPGVAAVYSVALIIDARWKTLGVRSWVLDPQGAPTPAPANLAHDVKQVPTAPRETALFYCARCGSITQPSKIPPRGMCKGFDIKRAFRELLGHLLDGGSYELDEEGNPRPAR